MDNPLQNVWTYRLEEQMEVTSMMYAYMTLADETEITYSHLIEENRTQIVEVHFERPTENGFDTARCRLPDYV